MQVTGISHGTMWRCRTMRLHRLAPLLAAMVAVLAFAGTASAAAPQQSLAAGARRDGRDRKAREKPRRQDLGQ